MQDVDLSTQVVDTVEINKENEEISEEKEREYCYHIIFQ